MRRLPLALSGGGGKNFLGMLLKACLILTRRVLDHLRVGRENMKWRQDCECGCLGAHLLGQGDVVLDSLSGSLLRHDLRNACTSDFQKLLPP